MTESPQLSTREREVMTLVAQGHTNAQIGQTLFLGEDTVKTHLRRALHKLGANNRTQAAIAFLKLTPQPHCGCCRRARLVLDTRRVVRQATPDATPYARLYDSVREALTHHPHPQAAKEAS